LTEPATEAPRTVIGTLEAFASASVVRAPQNAHLDEEDAVSAEQE
jgi:hypothetical protein